VSSLSGQWRLVHYYNIQTAETTSAPVDVAKSITLNFSDDGLKGTFVGHTLSNPISGRYELTKPGKILMSTEEKPTEDSDLGKIVLRGISYANAYKVSYYSLNLYFHEGKEVLIFVRL
jgi:hypothetical protein